MSKFCSECGDRVEEAVLLPQEYENKHYTIVKGNLVCRQCWEKPPFEYHPLKKHAGTDCQCEECNSSQ